MLLVTSQAKVAFSYVKKKDTMTAENSCNRCLKIMIRKRHPGFRIRCFCWIRFGFHNLMDPDPVSVGTRILDTKVFRKYAKSYLLYKNLKIMLWTVKK